MGPPITGPTALGTDARRFWRLAWTLAVTDFKLRFFGSALGYLWTLMRPLLLFGVLYFVFSVLFNLGTTAKYQPVALLLGLVMYQFLVEATSGGVRSLLQRESLVRKVDFPLLAVPTATVLTALFSLTLNFIPVTIFLLISGGTPLWTWVEVPFLVAALAVFSLGLAALLGSVFVRYRDVEPIWEVVLQALFYAAPIFYTISVVREKTHAAWIPDAIMFNPFAAVLQQARHAVIDPSHEDPVSVFGDPLLVLVPIGITIAVVVVGFMVFNRLAPHIAEEL
jgi:ABC-2 type transport system permease protein